MNVFVKVIVALAVCVIVATRYSSQAHAGLPITTSIENDAWAWVGDPDDLLFGVTLESQTLPEASVSYTDAHGTVFVTVTQLGVQNETGGSIGAYLAVQGSPSLIYAYAQQNDAITFGPNDHGHVYVIWDSNQNGGSVPDTHVSFGGQNFGYRGRFEGDAAGKTIQFLRTVNSYDSNQILNSGNSALYWSFNGWPGESPNAPLVISGESKSMPAADREKSILQDSSTFVNPNSIAIDTQANGGVGISTPVYTSHNTVQGEPNYNNVILKFQADHPISTVQVPTAINTGQLAINVTFEGCGTGNVGSLCAPGSGSEGPDADGLMHVQLAIGQEFNFRDYALNGVSQFLFTDVNPGNAQNPVDMPVGLKFITAGTTQLAITTYQAPLDPFAAVGDYNHDGVTNAADFVVWRHSMGQSGNSLAADGNASGLIEAGDFDVWRTNFGHTSIIGSGTQLADIPEPSTLALVFAATTILAVRRRLSALRVGC